MRIEFLTQDDPLYVLPFFEQFIRSYSAEFEIERIGFCRVMGKRSRKQLLRELMWLYGFWGLVRLCLRLAVFRCLSVLPRKRGGSRYYSLRQLCRAYGITCETVTNPNQAEYVSALKQRAPDVLVSVACPYILKEPVLQVAALGSVNIHHAPLPRYKGMMPTFWQMYHSEKSVGLTVHYMAAKVDEGDALLSDQLEIQPRESLDHLIQRSKRHGANCMATVLRQLQARTAQPSKLELDKGTYFTFPTREEALAFRQRGLRAI